MRRRCNNDHCRQSQGFHHGSLCSLPYHPSVPFSINRTREPSCCTRKHSSAPGGRNHFQQNSLSVTRHDPRTSFVISVPVKLPPVLNLYAKCTSSTNSFSWNSFASVAPLTLRQCSCAASAGAM